jgi:hypothetical protein
MAISQWRSTMIKAPEHAPSPRDITRRLVDRVCGPALLPEDHGYGVEQAGFQTAFRNRPDVVVGATGAADVRAAVD